MTAAEALFIEIFEGNPFEFLNGMLGSQEETEYLDFKACEHLTSDLESENVPQEHLKQTKLRRREIWSEYLSAFANTQGGVLIWGIKTSKTPGTEVAERFSLCCRPHKIGEELMAWLKCNVIEPYLERVQVKIVEHPDTNNKGLVVCFVPKSDRKPHKALAAERPDYYLRKQDSCYACQVELLRSLFYPRLAPDFSGNIEFRIEAIDKRDIEIRATLYLTNYGNCTARSRFVEYRYSKSKGPEWQNLGGNKASRDMSNDVIKHCCLERAIPMHPGMSDDVLTTTVRTEHRFHQTCLKIKVFTDNARARSYRFDINWRQIAESLKESDWSKDYRFKLQPELLEEGDF